MVEKYNLWTCPPEKARKGAGNFLIDVFKLKIPGDLLLIPDDVLAGFERQLKPYNRPVTPRV